MGADEKELTPGQVAARLRVSHSTVIRWGRTGELLPSQTLPSGYRRYDPATVDALGKILAMPTDDRDVALAALRAKNLAENHKLPE